MKMHSKILGVTAAVAIAFGASSAVADMTYSFSNISANNVVDAAAGESQLSVTVVELGGSQVRFDFGNTGPDAMSITDVYFDDGTLLGIASVVNTVGLVEFSQNASPGNLPSANNASPAFQTTAGFSADSDPPTQPMGVNPGETLGIVFDLIGGQLYADTIAALADGSLRIGIHVQGFSGGGSESFVNSGMIPAPGAALLGLIGLCAIAAIKRRQS